MSKRRNVYKLEDLTPKTLIGDELKQSLFLKSEELRSFEWIELIEPWDFVLKSDVQNYYILFEYVVFKGKRKIFKGETALVDKVTTAAFIKKIVQEDIECPLRIMPQKSVITFLIRIHDTTCCSLYEVSH